MHLDEAVKAAVELEAFYTAERQRTGFGKKVVRVAKTEEGATDEVNNELQLTLKSMMEQIKDLSEAMKKRPRGNQRTAPRDISKVQCYNCKQFGHYKRDCPQNSQPDQATSQSGNDQQPSSRAGARQSQQ